MLLGETQLLLDYRDIAGRTYSTAIVMQHGGVGDYGRYYDVRFGEDTPFTQHTATHGRSQRCDVLDGRRRTPRPLRVARTSARTDRAAVKAPRRFRTNE